MATHTYQVTLSDEQQTVNAEDFRVIDSTVVFYRHIMGDKANTHLFKLEDVKNIQITDSA